MNIEKPLPESARARIHPAPWGIKRPGCRKMTTHMLTPVGKGIIAETEDRLHLVAHDANRKNEGSIVDDGMLPDRAILILINPQPDVARRDHVIDVLVLE